VFVNAWRLPRTILVGSGEHASAFIVPLSAPGDLSAARGITRSALAALSASTAGTAAPTAAAGIGGAVGGLVQARESWLQARIAARVAAGRNAPAPLVLEWPELGVHRLLGVGTDAALREAVLTSGVAALLEEGSPELLRTAKSYLDEAGSAQRTAQALGIHRQTLYHRLDRIERISGLSLDSGQHRLQLHLALTLLSGLEG
jgi:DNA-binding PucR family transcriptional regulator